MFFSRLRITTVIIVVVMLAVSPTRGDAPDTVNIAFFQGGEYPWHGVLREVVQSEIPRLIPDSIRIIYPPTGFVSADWDRDSCRSMARDLASRQDIDVIMAMGPWTVEDLIAADCDKPIIALFRFDPVMEGLVDSSARPIRDNLTVSIFADRYQNDISALTSLVNVKKLGVLIFPSNDEEEQVVGLLKEAGSRLGFEVVTAEGFTPRGAFAFFKAYQNLDRENVDALYISPLWGLTADMIGEFFRTVRRDGIAAFSSEGRYHVSRGAFASARGQTAASEGLFAVWKLQQIIDGTTPADLPVLAPAATTLAINEETARALSIPLPEYVAASSELIAAPPPEDAEGYRLPDAIAQCLAIHPDVMAASDAVDAAQRAAGEVIARYRPQLTLDAVAAYIDNNTVTNNFDELSNEQLEARLSVDQTIFSLVTLRQIRAARRGTDIREAESRTVRLDLEQAVTAAYLDHLAALARLSVETDTRLMIDRSLERAQAAEQIGMGRIGQAARWRSERNLAVQRIAQARALVDVTRTIFNVLLNRAPSDPIRLDAANFDAARFASEYYALQAPLATPGARERAVDKAFAEALASSAELQEVDRTLAMQDALKDVNRASWLPTIGFRAGLGVQDRLSERVGFSEEPVTWSVGARLTWPLFSGGRRFETAGRLDAEYSRIEFKRESITLDILSAVSNDVRRLTSLLTGGAVAAVAANDAADYIRLLRSSAENVNLTDQLDAVENYRRTHLRAITQRFAYHRQCADLVRVMGWSLFDRSSTPSIELVKFFSAEQPGE